MPRGSYSFNLNEIQALEGMPSSLWAWLIRSFTGKIVLLSFSLSLRLQDGDGG